ncbi:MAG: hypothetical protein NC121_00505 [Blautia sp.]|nr:hypothetical protein [Blautia sp.]
MEGNSKTFHYTYSAEEQEEIKSIREKYAPPEKAEDKMAQLRRLDASATKTAALVSVLTGTAGTLIMGVGMCCTMVWAARWFVPGIFIGVAGIAGVIAAYPVYVRMVRKKREKLAPEILRLSDELMK